MAVSLKRVVEKVKREGNRIKKNNTRNSKKRIVSLVAMFNRENLIKRVLIDNRRGISEIDAVFKYPEYIDSKRLWIGDIPAQLISYRTEFESERVKGFISKRAGDWILLQLHGGGYVNAFKKQYHNMAGLYAEAGRGIQVLSIDYRVAPEYKHPAALEDALAAYRWILDAAYDPKNVIIAGDSAGGGLSLALCAYLRDHDMPMPAGIIALSPWTDVSGSGESYETHYEDDPVFGGTRESLIYNNPYVSECDMKDPYISPQFGSFKGFPPMLIQVGELEMLYSDAEATAVKAINDGVDVTFTVYEGMFHVFQVAGTMLADSRRAWSEISKFIVRLEDDIEELFTEE